MPRRRLPPRLYLDKTRRQWSVRDGQNFIRTGCSASETAKAERVLGEYIARKYAPSPSPSPPIADVLLAYLRDKVPDMKSRSAKYNISNLARFWSDKTFADVTPPTARRMRKTELNRRRVPIRKAGDGYPLLELRIGPLDKCPKYGNRHDRKRARSG